MRREQRGCGLGAPQERALWQASCAHLGWQDANKTEKASASLLAPPAEPKKLEPPKAKNQEALPPKKKSARFEAALDDDIPF